MEHRDPDEFQTELLRLIVKAGRRCAYDLAHAVDYMEPGHMKEILKDRPAHWLAVFNPADDGKSYRDRLHNSIYELGNHVDYLQRLLRQNGIDYDTIDGLPEGF